MIIVVKSSKKLNTWPNKSVYIQVHTYNENDRGKCSILIFTQTKLVIGARLKVILASIFS